MMQNHFKNYLLSTCGATLMTFALAVPVVVGGMGVSVDMARGYMVKERLTHALDAAALAGAGSPNLNDMELRARIQAFFDKNYDVKPGDPSVDLNIETSGSTLNVSANIHMDTSFMKVLGVDTMEINGSSSVERQVSGLDVAMVLDVTGSMAENNNIASLRTAATNFTNILCPGTNCANGVKIGLVPFATTVNVGPYGLGQTPTGTTYDTAFVNNPKHLSFNQSNSTAWWGCILEQAPNNDVVDSKASWRWEMYRYVSNKGDTSAPNTSCNKAYILPLTIDKTTIKARISKLNASGNTLSNIGMVWGYRVLSPEFPFREGAPFHDEKIRKVALLMTDGDNNIGTGYSAYGPWATYKLTDNDLNTKLAATCENMKKDGITIYAVTFTSAIDENTKSFFRNCASEVSKYYDAPSQQELIDTFEIIAAELSNLYIRQ